jgi:hypothetical protein
MATKPYPRMNLRIGTSSTDMSQLEVEMELSATAIRLERKETLSIRTQVSTPLPDHPQPMELAALLRVHKLLGEQIEAMRSR